MLGNILKMHIKILLNNSILTFRKKYVMTYFCLNINVKKYYTNNIKIL